MKVRAVCYPSTIMPHFTRTSYGNHQRLLDYPSALCGSTRNQEVSAFSTCNELGMVLSACLISHQQIGCETKRLFINEWRMLQAVKAPKAPLEKSLTLTTGNPTRANVHVNFVDSQASYGSVECESR